jgi:hypothetical protein
MTVFRREDVHSNVASWDGRPYRIVRSPILAIVPLIIRRLRGPSQARVVVSLTYPARPLRFTPLLRRHRDWLQRRPEEASQLACDRDRDLWRWFVLFHQAPEPAT